MNAAVIQPILAKRRSKCKYASTPDSGTVFLTLYTLLLTLYFVVAVSDRAVSRSLCQLTDRP